MQTRRRAARRLSRPFVLVPVALVAVLLLPSTGRSPQAEFEPRPELVEAARTGKPVELVSERTATATTWVNPDGTFRKDMSSVPVRAKVGKQWRAVDLTLERRSDGSVGPKVSPGREVLSSGGSGPLLVSTLGGVRVTTSWPTKLPVPSIDGPAATYAEVLPGVDLRLTVTDAGTSQVLVVKTREAAQNPELQELRLRMSAKNGVVQSSKDGGLSVLDSHGREVATAVAPTMWDSRGVVRDERHEVVRDVGEMIAHRSVSPADGDAVALVRTTMARNEVVLRPNLDLLADTGVTFPLYIDPMTTPKATEWAMVRKQSPTSSYYKWTSMYGQGAGYDGYYLQRLYWRFDTVDFKHAQIQEATFSAKLLWTPSCQERGVQLWRTGSISSSTSWNNLPSWEFRQNTLSAAAGHDSCDPYGRTMEFNAVEAATWAADGYHNTVTLGLKAVTETDDESWKQFPHTVSLSVQYSFPPNQPSDLGLADPAVACDSVIGGVKPRVRARLVDVDLDNLEAEFEAYTGTTIVAANKIWSETAELGAASGTSFTSATRIQKADGTLPDGQYVWQVRAREASAQNLAGPWSGPCGFTVDNSVVAQPGLSVPGATVWSVDANPVTVTLLPTAAGGPVPANVAYYRWSLNSDSPTSSNVVAVGTSKQVPVSVATDKAGVNVLRVWAYISADSRSVPYVYTFDTNSSSAFAAQYLFDEGTGSITDDKAGTNDLTGMTGLWGLRGNYRDAGATTELADNFVQLTAASTPPQTANPVVSTNTSFTVSAWVDTSDLTAERVAVSQGAGAINHFTLGVSPTCGTAPSTYACYRFGVWNGTTMQYVESTRSAAGDVLAGLVHVVGDISKTGKARIRVIVDGQIQTDTKNLSAPAVTSATGQLIVGAAKNTSGFSNRWVGSIDNVMAMQGLLDDAALVQLNATDGGRCYSSARYDAGITPCAN